MSHHNYTNCTVTNEEQDELKFWRTLDVVLFSITAILWAINIAFLVVSKKPNNKLVSTVLYGIIGLLITTRLAEVSILVVYRFKTFLVVVGVIGTYSKIALACCQLSAMLEIRSQMKEHII